MSWLLSIRSELSDQLVSARGRRTTLANQYEKATGANRAGLEEQLRILDQRIGQLEMDMAAVGRAASAPEAYTSVATPNLFNLNPGQITGISIVFTIFVLFPVAIAAARNLWRRPSRPATPPGWTEAAQRLERVENAVDTIAIEIERVTEAQRFMTKIMTQQPARPDEGGEAAPALNGGQPLALPAASPEQPLVQRQREEVRVRRS